MKKIAIIAIFVFLCGCLSNESFEQRQEERKRKYIRDIVNSMIFIKEKRTGLCFVYLWNGMSDGGPAISEISCGKVPSDILIEE
jgi:hypothetical protein